jgi:hypothetical protein
MMLIVLAFESTSITAVKNIGAEVTRSEQVKVLLSTSLAAFTVVGKSESFPFGAAFRSPLHRPGAICGRR